jgi:hypothetical protein
MKLFYLLLVSIPCFGVIGTPIPLTITNASGFSRTGNKVMGGIPIAESFAITNVRNLSITICGGANQDSDRIVTERWHGDPTDNTKSIKAILVITDYGANLCLADRVGSDPGTSAKVTVNSSDTCPVSGVCTTINNTINKYWIRHDSFNVFDQVQRVSDGFNYLTPSASRGIVATTSAGTYTSATAPIVIPGILPYTITTEEPLNVSTDNEDSHGLFARIHVTGALWNGSSPKFSFDYRIYLFGGESGFLIKGTNIHNEDMFASANQPTAFGVQIPTSLGSTLNTTFGTVYGSSTTSTISHTSSQDVSLIQYGHGNIVSNTAPVIGTTASVSMPNYFCGGVVNIQATENCPSSPRPGYRIVKAGTTQSTGSQSDGSISVDDGTNQINLWIRDFWQNYPGELEANGSTISFWQWPKHGDIYGDLTATVGYARDMALAGFTGFGHFWPWIPGAAMNLTPQSPNPNRGFFTQTVPVAGQPVRFSLYGVNYKLSDSPCNGVGCNFWQQCTLNGSGFCTFDASKARRVFVSGITGGYAGMNNYKLGMFTGSTAPDGSNSWPNIDFFNEDGTPIDASGFGSLPVGFLGKPGTARIGTMDANSDSQMDSFGRYFELHGNFTSHASANLVSDVAKWRDTLLFTNPVYFSDTSLFLGHLHVRDTTNFLRAEREVDNYFNSLYKREVVNNLYGIYYGFQLYGGTPAGFGTRYIASLDRRRYLIAYWTQFIRTGDSTYFHRAQSILNAVEAEMQHPPQVLVTSSYNGIGLDRTGSAASNIFWNTKWYIDSNNILVAKSDGSLRCTEGYGGSVWFPTYNASPAPLSSGGATVNRCPDGQQPWLDYPSTFLKLNYQLTGDYRSKDLVQSIATNALFSMTNRTNVLDETASLYTSGGAFGRSFGGCVQLFTDAAEILGSSYISGADACFKANIQNRAGINVWTQNPTGLLYDDSGIGTNSATPTTTGAHTHYGSHYFVSTWCYFSCAEYLSYKGNVTVAAPTYATGHAAVNVQTAMTNFAKGAIGYFDVTSKNGGVYSYLFPGRIISDAYALVPSAGFLSAIKRSFDFHSMGADDSVQDTGCAQTGTTTQTGDLPGVAPIVNCASPSPSTGNPNATSVSTPDIHNGGLLALSFPYLENALVGTTPVIPNTPPSFVLVPKVGDANSPLTWVTNASGTFTFDLFLRIAVAVDFGNLSVVTPISGDFNLTILKPDGTPLSGITVQDSAGHIYTGLPTAVFKTPNQMWPPASGGGVGACLSAPAPPSINYTGTLNDKDNRDFLVTVPASSGEYKIQLTHTPCSDPNGTQVPVASLLSMSTGNVSLVTCTAPCNTIANMVKVETGSVQYVNIPSTATKFQADSSIRFQAVDPNGVLYRGGTTKTVAAGSLAIMQNGGWGSESSFVFTIGGSGGIKPLASPSLAYFWDSPNYGNQTFVSNINNPINLTLGGSGCNLPFITTSSLPSGVQNNSYNPITLTATGDNLGNCSGCSWSATGVPTGMSLSSLGVLSGTPTSAGSSTIGVTAMNSCGNSPLKNLSLTVNSSVVICPSGNICLNGVTLKGVTIQ